MSSTFTTPITITPASPSDTAELTEIHTICYLTEPISACMFTDWPKTATMKPMFQHRIEECFKNPKSYIFKAVDNTTSEIAGFVCLTEIDGEQGARLGEIGGGSEKEAVREIMAAATSGLNIAFWAKTMENLKAGETVLHGKKYFALTSLCVSPNHQRQGLGLALLDQCAGKADIAGLPTYLNAFPAAHDLYMKSGFEDVRTFDMDLNEWGMKNRGFGVYRFFSMLREPKSLSA